MAEEVSGTWLRGSDGGLYFIPDEQLEAFRIPDEIARPTLAEVDAADVEAFQDYELTADIEPLAAVRGPLGIRDLAAAPAIIPPPPKLRGLRAFDKGV